MIVFELLAEELGAIAALLVFGLVTVVVGGAVWVTMFKFGYGALWKLFYRIQARGDRRGS